MNREYEEYERKLREWEAEGYDVSEFRERWFPSRKAQDEPSPRYPGAEPRPKRFPKWGIALLVVAVISIGVGVWYLIDSSSSPPYYPPPPATSEPEASPPTTTTYYSLSTSVSPSGAGSVSPSGGTYESGSTVSLTAHPNSGYVFDHWGGDASGYSSSISIYMSSDKHVIAYFTPQAHPTVTTSPATAVTSNSAILNGILTSLGSDSSATVYFQYGRELYNGVPAGVAINVGKRASTGAFSVGVKDLLPNTTYYFRAVVFGAAKINYHGSVKSFTTTSLARTVELKYDDGTDESMGCWVEGGNRGYAVRFTSTSYPVSLKTARICLWDKGPGFDHEQFAVEVYDDDGGGGAPGTQLGTTIYTTATNWGWCDVGISHLGVTITSGEFYILYKQLGAVGDCERLCLDTSGNYYGRSWNYSEGAWFLQTGKFGNYMIRCVVEY